KITSVNFSFDNKVINNNELANAAIIAIADFNNIEASGKQRIANNTPNRAQSIVTAVVDETKRLRLSCCIIKPRMLNSAPASKILAKRGIRLINKICHCSASNCSKPLIETELTPINKEVIDNTANNNNRYRR